MTPTYPTRPSGFLFQFLKSLADLRVAGEIGPDACWLLTVILLREDATRFTRPVGFYSGQLAVLAQSGVAGVDRRCRAGWLHTRGGEAAGVPVLGERPAKPGVPGPSAGRPDQTDDVQCPANRAGIRWGTGGKPGNQGMRSPVILVKLSGHPGKAVPPF